MYQIIETFASWLWSTILLSSFMLILHYPHEYSQAKAILIQCCENTDNICISFHFASAHEHRRNNSFLFFHHRRPFLSNILPCIWKLTGQWLYIFFNAMKLYFAILNRFFVPMTPSYISQSPSLSQNMLIFLFQRKIPVLIKRAQDALPSPGCINK